MKRNSAAARRDEAAFNKTLITFAVACLLEIGLLFVNRYYGNVGTFMTTYYVLRVVRYASLALLAAGVVLAVLRRGTAVTAWGVRMAVLGAFLCLSTFFIDWFYPYGAQYLSVVVPVVAVLLLIWFLYQRAFFACALETVFALGGLWAVRRTAVPPLQSARVLAVCAAAAALILAALVFTLVLRGRDGRLTLRGRALAVFPRGTDYRGVLASGVLALAALAAGLFAGAAAAFYALIILAAYLFVLAVYFTVKLM